MRRTPASLQCSTDPAFGEAIYVFPGYSHPVAGQSYA